MQLFTSAPIVYNSYAIDPSLAKEQSRQAIIALVVSAVVVAVFLFLRFGIFYALAGLVSMGSAGIFSVCCFAMGQYVVNLPFVSAVLTVFAYAVNDCVVVFDRIRFEVARMMDHNCPVDLKNTVNRALSLVTIRSLLTLLTVMICSSKLACYCPAHPSQPSACVGAVLRQRARRTSSGRSATLRPAPPLCSLPHHHRSSRPHALLAGHHLWPAECYLHHPAHLLPALVFPALGSAAFQSKGSDDAVVRP